MAVSNSTERRPRAKFKKEAAVRVVHRTHGLLTGKVLDREWQGTQWVYLVNLPEIGEKRIAERFLSEVDDDAV